MESYGNKIKDRIRSANKNSDNYDQIYMKMRFNSDGDLPLKRILELHHMRISFRSVFHEGDKCYIQIFLDECFYNKY